MTSATYHHGDLPNALRRAAEEVIIEKGLGAFSLREVARRAGVSHAAPAHHFGDMRGLLTSLAIEGFTHLEASMRNAQAGVADLEERFVAMGQAYVRLGMERPAHCAVMFRHDMIDDCNEELDLISYEAFQRLEDLMVELRDELDADFDIGDATAMCWSSMQGLVQLWPSMQKIGEARGYRSADVDEVVRNLTAIMLNGLRPR